MSLDILTPRLDTKPPSKSGDEQRRRSPPGRDGGLSSWCHRGILAAFFLLAASCASAPPSRPAAELTNPFLAPAFSGWLVGPVGQMASRDEIEQFLALRSDQDAERFIEEFWRRRDPRPETPENPILELFERRAQEADRRFSEAGYGGRRTARGTLWVLHGAPETVEFELQPRQGEPPIEVWRYPRDAPEGLDGRAPRGAYRFIKRGDLTVSYEGPEPPERSRRPELGRPPGGDWQ